MHLPTNVQRHLADLKRRDKEKLANDWDDEAVEATLAGKPRLSWHLSEMSARLLARRDGEEGN